MFQFVDDDNRCFWSSLFLIVGIFFFCLGIYFIQYINTEDKILFLILTFGFIIVGFLLVGICIRVSKIYKGNLNIKKMLKKQRNIIDIESDNDSK